jgi:LysM repeat protein
MNKKELIIVAIFVNIGTLVLLVVGSIRPATISEEKEEVVAKVVERREEPKVIEPVSEIDQVIESIVAAAPKEVETPQDILKPFLSQDLTEVTVKSGDSLGKFAGEYSVSVEEIMRFNQLTGTNLQIGQTLYIPKKKATLPLQQALPMDLADHRYYTVKNGDSPWTIAMKNHIKVEELLRLNGLDEKKAKKLKAGDRLRIR